MTIEFIDLGAQQARIKTKIDSRIQAVLTHGNYIMGPEVCELEAGLAAFCGAKHALGCANGTDALQLALMALNVGPGDAVFGQAQRLVIDQAAVAALPLAHGVLRLSSP